MILFDIFCVKKMMDDLKTMKVELSNNFKTLLDKVKN